VHHEPVVQHHEVTHTETHYDMAPEALTHHKRFSFSKAKSPEEKKPAEEPKKEEEKPKKEEKAESTPAAEEPKDDKKVKAQKDEDEEDERLVGKRSDFDLTDKQKKEAKQEAEEKEEAEVESTCPKNFSFEERNG